MISAKIIHFLCVCVWGGAHKRGLSLKAPGKTFIAGGISELRYRSHPFSSSFYHRSSEEKVSSLLMSSTLVQCSFSAFHCNILLQKQVDSHSVTRFFCWKKMSFVTSYGVVSVIGDCPVSCCNENCSGGMHHHNYAEIGQSCCSF